MKVIKNEIHKPIKYNVTERFLIFMSFSTFIHITNHAAPNICNNDLTWETSVPIQNVHIVFRYPRAGTLNRIDGGVTLMQLP